MSFILPEGFNKNCTLPENLKKDKIYLIVPVGRGFNNGLNGLDGMNAGIYKNVDPDKYYFLYGPKLFFGKFFFSYIEEKYPYDDWNRFQDVHCYFYDDNEKDKINNFENWDKLGKMEFFLGDYSYFEKN